MYRFGDPIPRYGSGTTALLQRRIPTGTCNDPPMARNTALAEPASDLRYTSADPAALPANPARANHSPRMNKQIAAQLGLSEITVKIDRGNVRKKMGRSLADLVRTAGALAARPLEQKP